MKVVVLTALLVLVSACAESEDAVVEAAPATTATTRSLRPPYPGAGANCPSVEPSPISASMARATLRKHGFTVDEAEGWCGLELISTALTNDSSSLFTLSVMRREGLLHCFVLVAPRPFASANVVGGDTAAASAERRLANLDCDLTGAEERGFERHVLRLDRAFAELRERIRR